MSFGIANFDSLPQNVKLAFEDLEAWTSAFLLKEHNPDGTHVAYAARVDPSERTTLASGGRGTAAPSAALESHHWSRGPWTFDLVGQSNGVIGIRPSGFGAGPFNDFAPGGIDEALLVSMVPDASITITGLRAPENRKRLLVFGNINSSSYTITLTHQSANSQAGNRFSLPSATDIVLAADQFVWLYYDIDVSRWRCFVTPMQSGGLDLIGAVKKTTVSLSQAQLEALSTTPVAVVAAQGSGTIICPLALTIDVVQTAAYTNNPSWQLQYTGIAGIALISAVTNDFNNNRNKFYHRVAIDVGAVGINANVDNLAVELSFSAALTGAGAATGRATLWYGVLTGSSL